MLFMSAPSGVSGAQRERCAAYLDRLAPAAGHQDRAIPLKSYCIGLLLPGERKSVQPMAARLCPGQVRQAHQSLHHVVADAPWDDTEVLEAVRQYVLPVLQKRGPLKAWIVEDTGFKKKGAHSVGVTRQYCGQLGKPENCRVAVSLSLSTSEASLPIAWRLTYRKSGRRTRRRERLPGYPRKSVFKANLKLPCSKFAPPCSGRFRPLRSWPTPPTAPIQGSAPVCVN